LIFIAFLVKLPLYVLHLWLPKAHVEAPTIGSVVLAGLLLKLGVAGLIRLINLFHLQPRQAFLLLGLGGAAIAGASIIFQRDLKALVAFASVNHMNFLLAALQTHTRFSQERR
jgi:NADH-ubiquinone oxidoreductase chain 4